MEIVASFFFEPASDHWDGPDWGFFSNPKVDGLVASLQHGFRSWFDILRYLRTGVPRTEIQTLSLASKRSH